MHPSDNNRSQDSPEVDFETIVDSLRQIVWTAEPDGTPRSLNRRGIEYTGLPEDERSSWHLIDLVHPEDVDRAKLAWRDATRNNADYAVDVRLRGADGRYRRHMCRASPVRDDNGGWVGWIGSAIDVEDRYLIEERLQDSERQQAETDSLLETLQSTAPVGFGFCDRDFRVIRMNSALAATNGIPPAQQIGRTVAEIVPELWPGLEPLYKGVIETEQPVINSEASGVLAGDPEREHTWLTSFYPVRLGGEVIGIGIIVVDITERKEMERRLREISEHDSLTGIANRRRFLIELERVVRHVARYDHGGALLVIDIDNFKLTNDSYGHRVGDARLKSVAQVLTSRLRETDFVARIGGDEFAVLLPEASRSQALGVATEIRAQLNERPIGPPVEVSTGIALLGGAERPTGDDVLAAADAAMYWSKDAGGSQSTVYEGEVGNVLTQVRGLQESLDKGRFVLYAQPIVDLPGGRVVRRELLIRMLSESGKVIPPSDFLPIAEEFSLTGQIDRWVVGQALDLARREPFTVNLSARSIGDPGILAAVTRAIATGLNPGNLIFEITETAVVTDFDRALEFVLALGELGCDLALDDFGTGFGSFDYLKNLPARYVKIDMEFVGEINEAPVNKEIVRSIVEIARSLEKKTIAEGVENEDVMETLLTLGVDYGQGWYFGAPQPLTQAPTHRGTRGITT